MILPRKGIASSARLRLRRQSEAAQRLPPQPLPAVDPERQLSRRQLPSPPAARPIDPWKGRRRESPLCYPCRTLLCLSAHLTALPPNSVGPIEADVSRHVSCPSPFRLPL